MRRPWMRRFGALSMALWMSVSLAERAVPAHCPEHDLLGAALAQVEYTHAGMDAAHHGGHSHHCCCLEQCDCCAMPAPSSIARDPIPATVRESAVRRVESAHADAHPDVRLPFATAPPLASRA